MKIQFNPKNTTHIHHFNNLLVSEIEFLYTPSYATIKRLYHLSKGPNGRAKREIFDPENPEHMELFNTQTNIELIKRFSARSLPKKTGRVYKVEGKSKKKVEPTLYIEPRNLKEDQWNIPPMDFSDMKCSTPDIFGQRFS